MTEDTNVRSFEVTEDDMDPNITDYAMLSRANEGKDQNAWKQLEGQYHGYIVILLKGFGLPPSDVEDVAQEVIVTVWKRLHTYDKSRSKFRTWLQSIVRITAKNRLRAHYKRTDRYVEAEGLRESYFEEQSDDESFYERADVEWKTYVAELGMARIRKAFRGVSIEIFERLLKGEGVAEIALSLGVSESTVTSSKARVKQRLMQEIRLIKDSLETRWEVNE
ncbi:MAG: RNA polymerase sigma factor [Opitutales bacterium]